ncbi:MAG: hypothetical protein WAK17_01255 [Candidatus Nitrosopolaris sp.]
MMSTKCWSRKRENMELPRMESSIAVAKKMHNISVTYLRLNALRMARQTTDIGHETR